MAEESPVRETDMTPAGQSHRQPLCGKRVLVTRPEGQASALSRLLAELGAQPVAIPAIQIDPPASWEELDRAIAELDTYDWVVFTSANGVRSFFDRLHFLGRDIQAVGQAKVASIGPGTAEALRTVGVGPDFVPDEYVAEAVAAGLTEHGVAGARVLVPRAAEAREVLVTELRAHGARVDEVPAYCTTPSESSRQRLRRLFEACDLDAATFTSSSTVRNTVALLGEGAVEQLSQLVIACIGPIAARTAAELGLRVDVVATEYTIPGLVQALEKHFSDTTRRV